MVSLSYSADQLPKDITFANEYPVSFTNFQTIQTQAQYKLKKNTKYPIQ